MQPPLMRFLFVPAFGGTASFRSCLTAGTLAVRLTLPPVGCVKILPALAGASPSRCALPGAEKKAAPKGGLISISIFFFRCAGVLPD